MLTTGGTESILLAMLAYRNWSEVEKNIITPNMYYIEIILVLYQKQYMQHFIKHVNILKLK
jgi:sphinganine-1-phosphate aldolase